MIRLPRATTVAPSPPPRGRPSVSVIIPSYRYGSLLPGCVASVLDQDGVDVRVLIVDDCSPDDTAAVGRALADADPRVELRRHEVNRGLIGTANGGLEWADGDYVVLLSADDFLTPGALARATAVMEEHPSVGLVYGHAPYYVEGQAFPRIDGTWRGTSLWSGRDWVARRCASGHNCISSPEVVVRASVHRAVGGYDPACTHASDLNMWLRVAAVADVAYVRGAPQAVYRVHPGSMLRSSTTPIVDLRERWQAFASFFAGSGAGIDGGEALRRTAARVLARQALWRASRAVDRDLLHGDDAVPVDELVAFALEVYPDARSLREWHGLQARRRIGAGRSRFFPLFLATGAAHRIRGQASSALWARTGV